MSVKGEIRSNQSETSFQKYVGLEQFRVLKFNPTKEELSEILEIDLEKDPTYSGEDNDGNAKTYVNVWLEGEETKEKFCLRFTLMNLPAISKQNPENKCFINSVGRTTYADDVENLPDWFTSFLDWKTKEPLGDRMVRAAHVGEKELYNFLTAWLDVKTNKVGAEIIFDFDKLMAGDMSELETAARSQYAKPFIGVATVNEVEKDGEKRNYQRVSTKAYLPGTMWPYITLGSVPKKYSKTWEYFTKQFVGEYGEKDFFSLDKIHVYDPKKNMAASDDVKSDISDDDENF